MSDETKEEVKKDAEKIEEAEYNAYMEAVAANGEIPKESERKDYYKARYNNVKTVYKSLILQKEEAEGYRDKDQKKLWLDKLTPAFRDNYRERIRIVTELRTLGEKVDDPFVPLSKTSV